MHHLYTLYTASYYNSTLHTYISTHILIHTARVYIHIQPPTPMWAAPPPQRRWRSTRGGTLWYYQPYLQVYSSSSIDICVYVVYIVRVECVYTIYAKYTVYVCYSTLEHAIISIRIIILYISVYNIIFMSCTVAHIYRCVWVRNRHRDRRGHRRCTESDHGQGFTYIILEVILYCIHVYYYFI